MRNIATSRIALAMAGALTLAAGAAWADEDADLVINGEIEMTVRTDAAPHLDGHLSTVYSGWVFREDDTQTMQADDFDNPGMIFVDQARDMWDAVEGSEGKSCASCHDAPESMAGVTATYPKWNDTAGEIRTVQMQVNACREERMGAEPLKLDSAPALAMQALLTSVSRGLPVNVAIDGPAQSAWEKGKEIYYTRYGQLELSCANCHEDNYGNYIRADHLSQGQVNAFPAYRLKDAALVGVQKRFEGCIRDTRAEPFKPGSPEFIALELYVASRGNGLSVEGPSVRN